MHIMLTGLVLIKLGVDHKSCKWQKVFKLLEKKYGCEQPKRWREQQNILESMKWKWSMLLHLLSILILHRRKGHGVALKSLYS